ncbi:MBL fold metallo-hydrolase [Nonomuraea rhizosphaerae]|uniref:MBL fold metallo-hydrolase n=1 Tax=Nonomuraea rhizosphaerae TaxID=2665663 RepID=UPI001C5D5F5A|nr:MBL fold metallo-hydrolase [Nonomuraea rhizosphaerae]
MRIHHLNLASMREIDAGTPAVCHALLVETPASGLVLVESGLGLDDVTRPGELLAAEWVSLVEPALVPGETAVRQLARLGHDPADVRHILLTHLDVDHSGGLPDFPGAEVHVMAAELKAALAEAPSRRYRPSHWAHGPRWVTYDGDGERWFGVEGVRPSTFSTDFLMVPLGGHTRGHAGVAVRDGERWLLHAGDAYFHHGELAPDEPRSHPLMDIVQLDSQVDEPARLASQARLRDLANTHSVDVFCAHDPWELRRCQ